MSLDDITLAVDYFDLKKIAESGQCFRWKELGPGKYLIPSGQTCAIMEQKEPDDDLHLLIEEGTLPLWQDYLNYGERYGSIVREAREATLADGSPDLFLREAVLEAAGVQILTQDLWETLVSFVISQNNNIPRIKKLVAALCITSDGNGEMVVAEMVPQIPGQMNMDGTQQEAPKILKLVQAAN